MNKVIFIVFLVFCAIPMSAQSNSSIVQSEMNADTQRVDSLEHALSYLNLSYELGRLSTDLTIFSNEVRIFSLGIRLDLATRNFAYQLRTGNRQYYESCLERKQSYCDLIEAKKNFFALMLITHSFSESELGTLMANYNLINDAFQLLEKSVNFLKITIDAYNEAMD